MEPVVSGQIVTAHATRMAGTETVTPRVDELIDDVVG
jgi:hypothetical protein